MQVYIDPRCIITYSSFYIQGLYDSFGRRNVHFSNRYFQDIDMKREEFRHRNDALLLFVLVEGAEVKRRIAVDFRDSRTILPTVYAWTDTYAKINYHKEQTQLPAGKDKLLSIPPSFAVRLYGLPVMFWHLLRNTWSVYVHPSHNFSCMTLKQFWINYIYLQFRREKLSLYERECHPDGNYVFFISTFWNQPNCIENTNVLRARYMYECKRNPQLSFEGGFLIKEINEESANYADLQLDAHIPIKQYIEKTCRSTFVFNTPSCWDCHGWKLGEFLAMGKAIISTPVTNELPIPLTQGENICVVNSDNELSDAIAYLQTNVAYRHTLEQGAKKYYDAYASPRKVIEYIINKKY